MSEDILEDIKNKKGTSSIAITMQKEDVDALKFASKKAGMSMSQFVRALITFALTEISAPEDVQQIALSSGLKSKITLIDLMKEIKVLDANVDQRTLLIMHELVKLNLGVNALLQSEFGEDGMALIKKIEKKAKVDLANKLEKSFNLEQLVGHE